MRKMNDMKQNELRDDELESVAGGMGGLTSEQKAYLESYLNELTPEQREAYQQKLDRLIITNQNFSEITDTGTFDNILLLLKHLNN